MTVTLTPWLSYAPYVQTRYAWDDARTLFKWWHDRAS